MLDTITVTGNGASVTLTGPTLFNVTGGAGSNTIIGSDQADTIAGGAGFDNISGGAGVDVINATYADFTDDVTGTDTVDGGDGADTLALTSVGGSVGSLGLTNVSNVETLSITTTGATAVTSSITLNQATATRLAGAGTLTVNVTDPSNDDTVTIDLSTIANAISLTIATTGAAAGARTATTGSGNDTVNGSGSGDTINGGAGNDAITGGAEADSLTGGTGDDTIIGGGGLDTINGGDGADIFTASGGGTDFQFRAGDVDTGETITFGAGADNFSVVTSTDFSAMNAGTVALTGLDTIGLASGTSATFLAAQITGLTTAVTGVNGGATESLIINGTTGADTITLTNVSGVDFTTVITGGAGVDTITLQTAGDPDIVTYSASTDGGATGDVITVFVIGEDLIQFTGALATALDDVGAADQAFTFATAAGGAGVLTAANLSTVEALLVNTAENGSIGTLASITTTSVAAMLNAEFVLTTDVGGDALVVVEGDTAGEFKMFIFEEAGTAGVQAAELTLLGTVTADTAITTAEFSIG